MKTPRELGITIKERNGLVKVRDGLANGEYRHVKFDSLGTAKDNGQPLFHMNHWRATHYDCGTVGCIGGWLETITKTNIEEGESDFKDLFYPYDLGNWDKITPAKAAKAIDNFLNGKQPWDFMRPKSERKAA